MTKSILFTCLSNASMQITCMTRWLQDWLFHTFFLSNTLLLFLNHYTLLNYAVDEDKVFVCSAMFPFPANILFPIYTKNPLQTHFHQNFLVPYWIWQTTDKQYHSVFLMSHCFPCVGFITTDISQRKRVHWSHRCYPVILFGLQVYWTCCPSSDFCWMTTPEKSNNEVEFSPFVHWLSNLVLIEAKVFRNGFTALSSFKTTGFSVLRLEILTGHDSPSENCIS